MASTPSLIAAILIALTSLSCLLHLLRTAAAHHKYIATPPSLSSAASLVGLHPRIIIIIPTTPQTHNITC